MITKNDIIQKIRDDLYLTGKQKIMDSLPENQNALFVGKLRIPTKMHIEIIKEALKSYNHIVICIVKASKDVKESLSLIRQEQILYALFGDKISIISHSSGNLLSIINKSPKRIKYLLCGSDRVDSYKQQLLKLPNIRIIETHRDLLNDISATKTIDAIKNNDEVTFKKMTDTTLWNMFSIIKGELNEVERSK